jgi:predicted metal-binding membrane protein
VSSFEPTASPTQLPRVAREVTLLVAATIAAAWAVTWWTFAEYNSFLMMQFAGAAPTDLFPFILLSGVMMVAMMLPSAMPMVKAYRVLVSAQAGAVEARVRTWTFTGGYLLVWTGFAVVSLGILAAVGLMGDSMGPFRYAPGILLVAMGLYQLTAWKRFCLRQCRTPTSFVLTRWKGGRLGALRMGLDHAAYCVGCCWLLMLALFVAGGMSLLWMAVFSTLILGEKLWAEGERFSKALGGAGIALGSLAVALAALGP